MTNKNADFFHQVLNYSSLQAEEIRKKGRQSPVHVNTGLNVPRPKHIPEQKTQTQLFDEQCHISKGPWFNENFGVQHDPDIRITGGVGVAPPLANTFPACNFDSEILQNLQRRHYSSPTQVQKAVIPWIQNNESDLMIHAHTGTGKSAAFLLPLINEIQMMHNSGSTHHNGDSPYGIIVAPTRELVKQLYEEALIFATGTSVSVAVAYGDIPMGLSVKILRSGCELLVTTIGRLIHYLRESIIKHEELRYFVLDEGDKLLQFDDVLSTLHDVLSYFQHTNSSHRTFMLSATFEEGVREIAKRILKPNFCFISVGELNQAVSTVSQTILKTDKYEKKEILVDLLRSASTQNPNSSDGNVLYKTEKTIIFINGRRECDRLGIALAYYGYSVITLNSSRTQNQRNKAQEDFTKGTYDILVSTDVSSRGLNFPKVGHVINFDMPRPNQSEQYVHRIGRTGRAGNMGRSTTFFDPQTDMEHAEYLYKILERSSQVIPDWLEDIIEVNRRTQSESAHQQQRSTMIDGYGDEENRNDGIAFW